MENKIKHFRLIQLLIAVLCMFVIFTIDLEQEEFFIPYMFVWFPFFSLLVFIVGVIVEFCCGIKPIIRTCLLSVVSFFSLVCLFGSISYASFVIVLFCLLYVFILIVVCVKNDVPYVKLKVKSNVLPDGVCSKKELYIIYGYWIFFSLVVVCFVLLLDKFEINFAWLGIVCFLGVICNIVIVSKTNVLINILKVINNDLDIEHFIDLIDEVLSKNINPEMYNYLLIIKANYLFCYDLDMAISIFEKTHKPNNKRYVDLYNVVKIVYEINSNKKEEALKDINELKSSSKFVLENMYKVLLTKDEMLNIESLYLENTKIRFNNVSSLEIKMIYYYTRNEINKAIEYAERLVKEVPQFKEYVKIASQIINQN